jgi:cobalt-zinc-cadmium efflux system membrane fusion protein
VSPVGEQQVGRSLVTSGRIGFDDTRVAHVFSPVTGRVVEILAPLGGRVSRGAPLAVIDSPDLGSAHSDFLKARADLTAAERDFQRQKELYEAHAGAQRDMEAAEDNFRRAKAELERAREKTRMLRIPEAEAVTQSFTLRSPIDGRVIARNVNPGTEIQGQYSGGNAVELYTIGEMDRVWVLADAYEVDLPRVKQGAPVGVTVVSYPGKTFDGTVDWISGALDPAAHTAKVRCTIANPQGELRAEMFATVTIAVEDRRALAVPRDAVLRLGDQTAVFVEKGSAPQDRVRFEKRVVTVEDDGEGRWVPVLSGLAAGENVVTSGAILLVGAL